MDISISAKEQEVTLRRLEICFGNRRQVIGNRKDRRVKCKNILKSSIRFENISISQTNDCIGDLVSLLFSCGDWTVWR